MIARAPTLPAAAIAALTPPPPGFGPWPESCPIT